MRALVLALVLALAPRPAGAQERLTIEWTGPEGCGGASEVRGEVSRLLSGAIPEDGPPIVAEARAAASPEGFSLELRTETGGAEGVRSLAAADCAELVDACGLILALMIDPEAALAATPIDEPEPAPAAAAPARSLARQLSSPIGPPPLAPRASAEADVVPSSPSVGRPRTESPSERSSSDEPELEPPASARTDPDAPPSAEPVAEAPSAFFGAGGLVDLTTLPQVSGGPFVDVGLGGPLVEARLRINYLAPQSAVQPAGVGAELMALSAAARVCLRPVEDARWFGACAGLDLGAVFGRGFGVSDPTFGAGFWMGTTLGVGLAWRALEWLDLSVDADLVIPLVDNVFSVVLPEGELDVFVPEDAGGRLSLSLHVHFGL